MFSKSPKMTGPLQVKSATKWIKVEITIPINIFILANAMIILTDQQCVREQLEGADPDRVQTSELGSPRASSPGLLCRRRSRRRFRLEETEPSWTRSTTILKTQLCKILEKLFKKLPIISFQITWCWNEIICLINISFLRLAQAPKV